MVQVRSYTKKDGTRVSAHTRSAPGGGVVAVVAGVALVVTLAPGPGPLGGSPTIPSTVTRAKVDARAKMTVQAMARLQRRGYRVTARASGDGR